jgi:hypothetical protein
MPMTGFLAASHEATPAPAEAVRAAFDWLSVGIVAGVVVSIISPIAQVLTVVWLSIRIWQSPTVLALRRRWRVWRARRR